MEQPFIYEGTVQEIAEQLWHSNTAGRLKAIIVQDTQAVQDSDVPDPAQKLADFLALVDQIEFTPGKPRNSNQPFEVVLG